MRTLAICAVGLFALGGAVKYANQNYDDIAAGIAHVADTAAEARAERQRNAVAAALVDVSTSKLLFREPIAGGDGPYLFGRAVRRDRDAFLEAAFSGHPAWDGAAVRLKMAQGRNRFWVTDLRRAGDGTMSGEILLTARAQGPKVGARVSFTTTEIYDWAIRREGQVYGLHTLRPVLGPLPPSDAARVAAFLSPEPNPSAW